MNCTIAVLPKLVEIVNDAGLSEVLGNRVGSLLQGVSSSSWLQAVINGFVTLGDDAARMCPHHPLYGDDIPNSTSTSTLHFHPFLVPIS
jgi:hypothetical protein